MKRIAAVLGIVSLFIAAFFLGNYLAMSQARSIVRAGMEVATSSVASSSMVRVTINTKILESIRQGEPLEAAKWACKDLSSAKRNLEGLSESDFLNKENVLMAIQKGTRTYAEACVSTESPPPASADHSSDQ